MHPQKALSNIIEILGTAKDIIIYYFKTAPHPILLAPCPLLLALSFYVP